MRVPSLRWGYPRNDDVIQVDANPLEDLPEYCSAEYLKAHMAAERRGGRNLQGG